MIVRVTVLNPVINVNGQSRIVRVIGASGIGPAGPAGPTGPAGAQGPPGADGAQGPAGVGIPAGGTTGQLLSKSSNTDYATAWTSSVPSHTHAASDIVSGTLALARGGAGADLSGTGGTGQFLKQQTVGGAVTVGAIAASELPSGIDAAKIGGGSVSNAAFANLAGTTSSIQSQIDGKAATVHTHAASDIVSGVIASARLGTGVADNTTVLYGDGVFRAPPQGSVQSVGLSLPSQFSVSGSPVTGTGTLAGAWVAQAVNVVLAGPTSGGSASPTFRALVAADIPNLDAAKIATGAIALARGGTSADLSATGGTGQFLKQTSAGGAVSVSAIAASEIPSGIDATKIGSGTVSNTAFGFVAGVTSAIQTQIDNKAATVHTHAASDIVSGALALARGGTNADLSATGGAGQVLKQTSTGGAVSVGTLAASELSNGVTGSGTVVLASAPAIVGGTHSAITGLGIRSTGAAFDLLPATSEVLTANRTLSIVVNNADRTLTVAGNATISGTNTGDVANTAVTTGTLAQFAATTSAQLAGVISDKTGTGALVFSNSPTFVTPALGTPSSGVLTSCTGLPISTGVSGLAAGVATFLATPSSANLRTAVTDETGSGSLVFGTSPTITGGTHTALTNLGIRSTGTGAFDLRIVNTENLTATRNLTITLGNVARVLTLTGDATISGTTSGTNTGDQTITLSGAVTGSGTGAVVTTIPAGSIVLSKLVNATASTLIGRGDSGSGSPQELTIGDGLAISGTTLSVGSTINHPIDFTDQITFSNSTTFTAFADFQGGLNADSISSQSASLTNCSVSALSPQTCTFLNQVGGSGSDARDFLIFDNQRAGWTGVFQRFTTTGSTVVAEVLGTGQFRSYITTGTAPFVVASTTAVTNLNADLLDGQHAAAFAAASHTHAAADITTGTLAVARGGTGADMSSTGGTGNVVKQKTAGGAFTAEALTAGEMPSGIDAAKIGGGGVSNTVFGYLVGTTAAVQTQLDNAKTATFGITIEPTSTGIKGHWRTPVAGTILKVTMIADVSGSAVIDIKKSTYSGFPTTSSICASAKPTLSSAQKSEDGTLTGWTKTFAAGDVFEFNLDSWSTLRRVILVVDYRKD